jgi:hypothetical protein
MTGSTISPHRRQTNPTERLWERGSRKSIRNINPSHRGQCIGPHPISYPGSRLDTVASLPFPIFALSIQGQRPIRPGAMAKIGWSLAVGWERKESGTTLWMSEKSPTRKDSCTPALGELQGLFLNRVRIGERLEVGALPAEPLLYAFDSVCVAGSRQCRVVVETST